MNIKIVSLKDQILLLLKLANGDILRLTSSHPTHARAIFYTEVTSFTKNGDKFGWVKYWQMTFNSPKFSRATILRYTVFLNY